jgi:hypothetical protein
MAVKNRLEDRLVLNDYVYACLGLRFDQMQQVLRDCAGGTVDSGLSCYAETLRHQVGWKLSRADFARYDLNISAALDKINARRTLPVTLKYFQWMAALQTEYLLDRLSDDRDALIADINRYVRERNKGLKASEAVPPFGDGDLQKLAFWMATGSGKTLLMHLNYHQYLHYFKEQPPQNILLITPNEGLSAQHEQELLRSDIPVERWRGPTSASDPMRAPHTVLIIEITKLNATKRGSAGVSASSASFSKPNLLFVDEGHKGSAGDAWKNVRDLLGAGGFTFEYSATFGQAVNAASSVKEGLLDEYSKSIAFDYSYKFFYNDGYGKDYAILNLPENFDEQLADRLLLGNLLTFYSQRRAYDTHRQELRPYNLEPPLWVFVGSSVNAVSKNASGKSRSDVLDVAHFLHRFLSDSAWATNGIAATLAGQSGLQVDGYDLFAGRFPELKALGAPHTYQRILEGLFHATHAAGLRLSDLAQADGEIALYAGGAGRPFGVINIGDTAAFLKLAAEAGGLTVEADRFGGSLFGAINRPDSPINVLIGSKKFTEGWNSWRVSSMSLLNIGKNEGSQIIQLFGRGVRLQGYERSLQRSIRPDAASPPAALAAPLRQLETLSIFGIRADYMDTFRKYLTDEGLETDPLREISIPVRPRHEATYPELRVPTLRQDANFAEHVPFELCADPRLARIQLALDQEVQAIWSEAPQQFGVVVEPQDVALNDQHLQWLDWNRLLLALRVHKQRRGYYNMAIPAGASRAILEDEGCYSVKLAPKLLEIRSVADVERIQTIAQMILEKYADQYYKRRKLQWESERLHYRTLDQMPDLIPYAYTLQIRSSNTAFIAQIQELQADGTIYTEQPDNFPAVFLDEHLYQPLLTADGAAVKISPVGLKASERTFAEDLRDFIGSHPRLFEGDRRLYLLRNLSRGKGIGFFETAGFYPDFILWLITPEVHHVVFIDPKGILNLADNFDNEKVQLYSRIKTYERQLQPSDGPRIQLDSFIDSETKRSELDWKVASVHGGMHNAVRDDYRKYHILFQQDGPARLADLFADIDVTV